MSSILEALKKLEADKGAHPPVEAMTPADNTFGGTSALLEDSGYTPQEARPVAPLLWVLGGGVFTVMIIGVSVLLVMVLLQQQVSDSPRNARSDQPAATPPPPTEAARVVTDTTAEIPAETDETTPAPADLPPEPAPEVVTTRVTVPVTIPEAPQKPRPTPAPTPRPTPQPEARPNPSTSTAPIPEDIRSLPMLTRHERSQYNLEGIRLNMLNAAGPTRPLGNAFINLEKVFIGEYLPDSNAVLLDVASHGIAVEIQSTKQRYYIPR